MSPSASGSIDVAAGVDTAAYTRLVVALSPADGDTTDASAIADEPLPTTWPTTFDVGGEVNPAPHASAYEVTAWLATDEGTTAPPAGAPHASAAVSCCTATQVALALAP